MKNKIITILLSILCLCLCSCNNETERQSKSYKYTIDLDNTETIKQMHFSDFYDNPQTIIFETSETSLIHNIDKLVALEERVFVLDKKTKTVSEFDMVGKFIRKFGNVGRGYGEYSDPHDFTIDEKEHNIWILDLIPQRLLCYDLNTGEFKKEVPASVNRGQPCYAIAFVGNIMYGCVHYFNTDSPQYLLKSFELDNPETENNYYLDRSIYLSGWNNPSIMGICKFICNDTNDYNLLTSMYMAQVFKTGPNGIENYINIKSEDIFGEKDRREISPQLGKMSLMNDPMLNANKYFNISDYIETDRHICFSMTKGMTAKFILFDKHTNETMMVNFIENNLLLKEVTPALVGIARFICANKTGAFYMTETRDIKTLSTAAREGMLVDGLDRLDELKELPEDSNPVLFYLKFKEPLQK